MKDATNTKAGAKTRVLMTSGKSADVATSEDGTFVVRGISSGGATVSVEADGFVTVEQDISVTSHVAPVSVGDCNFSSHKVSIQELGESAGIQP